MVKRKTRFWTARDGVMLIDEDGFLVEGSRFGPRAHLIRVEPHAVAACSVLLGESGLGKTTELDRLVETIKSQPESRVLALDLGTFQSDSSLTNALLADPHLQSWRDGSGLFHLALDALDEGQILIPNLPGVLQRCLGQLPCDRLCLYVTCRPGEWPQGLEAFLKRQFEGCLAILELGPLRVQDVLQWAEEEGIRGEEFVAQLRERRAGPFAARPVTLAMLIRMARGSAGLPMRMSEVYQRGCQALADEWNPRRRDLRDSLRLTACQRVDVASWIAAATTFTARPRVWLGPIAGAPIDAVALDELVDTLPPPHSIGARQQIIEVLATALFAPSGDNAVTWSHRSYAEYLTAAFCALKPLPLAQQLGLTLQPTQGSRRYVPSRLRGTAGWLGTLSADYRVHLLTSDPFTSLQGDLLALCDQDRAAVLEGVLAAVDQGLPQRFYAYQYPGLRRLRHGAIEASLLRVALDRKRRTRVRVAALQIVEACDLVEVGDRVADLALDLREEAEVREAAARTLANLEAPAACARLVPLATESALRGADPDDQLLGCALRAVWPLHLGAYQTLLSLQEPKRPHFLGSYSIFLGELADELATLSGPGLAQALAWVEVQPEGVFERDRFCRVALALLCRGWERSSDEGVAEVLARIVLVHFFNGGLDWLQHGIEDLRQAMSCSDDRLRILLHALELSRWSLPYGPAAILTEPLVWIGDHDLAWIVEQARATSDDVQREFWYDVLGMLPFSMAWYDQVWSLCESSPGCRDRFRTTFGPIEITSEVAEQARESLRRAANFAEQRAARQRQQTTVLADSDLAGFVAESAEGEWQFVRLQQALHSSWLEPDMALCTNWARLTTIQQERVLVVAQRFLEIEGEAAKYVPSEVSSLDMAAFRALYTLATHRPSSLEGLQEHSWARWAVVLVAYPRNRSTQEAEASSHLFQVASRHASSQLLGALELVMEHEASQEDRPIFVLDRFEGALGLDVLDHAFAWAGARELGQPAFESILSTCLRHGSTAALDWAFDRLNEGPSNDDHLSAAVAVLTHAPRRGWSRIQDLMTSHPELAREAFLRFADETDRQPRRLLHELAEPSLGELYLWLASHFPHAEDPEYNGRITPRHDLKDLRSAVLSALRNRATPAAIDALELVRSNLQADWLDHVVAEAQERLSSTTEQPITLGDLAQLVRRAECRLVETGDQLLGLVVEALDRLETELQGELPAVRALWNETEPGVWRPKEEEELSDYVARFLTRDLAERGVVLGREVQIRRKERTDIRVWAIAPQRPSVGLVIEVKGCWHREVDTSMGSQLRDRYLAENGGCRHGLYLVGHYSCERWDTADRRGSAKWTRRDRRDLSDFLQRQAGELSNGVKLASWVLNVSHR